MLQLTARKSILLEGRVQASGLWVIRGKAGKKGSSGLIPDVIPSS